MQPDFPKMPLPRELTKEAVEQFGRECVQMGLANERAAVMLELDALARRFDADGRPNTARAIRESAARIDARLRDTREWR